MAVGLPAYTSTSRKPLMELMHDGSLTDAARNAAAVLIEERWREHRVALRINAMIQMNEAREERRQIVAAERAAQEDRNALDRLLEGAVARVWPVVREVLIVMSCAVTVVLVAPEAFSTLPLAFDVRDGDDPWQQMRAASLGAAIAVSAFAALFLALVLLYVHTCTRMLYALHSLWIGSLIGGPLVALLPRLCQAAGAPLDVFTLAFLAWNVTVGEMSAVFCRFGRRKAACAICACPLLTAECAIHI